MPKMHDIPVAARSIPHKSVVPSDILQRIVLVFIHRSHETGPHDGARFVRCPFRAIVRHEEHECVVRVVCDFEVVDRTADIVIQVSTMPAQLSIAGRTERGCYQAQLSETRKTLLAKYIWAWVVRSLVLVLVRIVGLE